MSYIIRSMLKELVPGDDSRASLPIPPLGIRPEDQEDSSFFEEEIERRFGPITEVFPPYHNYYDESTSHFIHWTLETCDWEKGHLRFSGETTDKSATYNSEYRLLEMESGKVTARRVHETDLGGETRRIMQIISPREIIKGTIVTEAVEYYQGDHCLSYTVHQEKTEAGLVPYRIYFAISVLLAPNEDWTLTKELTQVDYDPEIGQFKSAEVGKRQCLPVDSDSSRLVFKGKGEQQGERGWQLIAPRAINLEELLEVVKDQREDWWRAYEIFPFQLIQDPPEPVASLTS